MNKALLPVALLVSLFLIFSISCSSNLQAPSGTLRTWKVGDYLNYKGTYNGTSFVVTWFVTDEKMINGTDCYILQGNFTPSLNGLSTSTNVINKANGAVVEAKSLRVINGVNYSVDKTFNLSNSPYPLSVGKIWELSENKTTTAFTGGQNQTSSYTYNYTYSVEDVENVTVPAGTFRCFKIVVVSHNAFISSLYETYWVTDLPDMNSVTVKKIGVVYGDVGYLTEELVSYSSSK